MRADLATPFLLALPCRDGESGDLATLEIAARLGAPMGSIRVRVAARRLRWGILGARSGHLIFAPGARILGVDHEYRSWSS
jgi:hypothetical protein